MVRFVDGNISLQSLKCCILQPEPAVALRFLGHEIENGLRPFHSLGMGWAILPMDSAGLCPPATLILYVQHEGRVFKRRYF